MYLFGFKKIWNGLQTFIKVESRVYNHGEESTETRYYISSLALKCSRQIALAIRTLAC